MKGDAEDDYDINEDVNYGNNTNMPHSTRVMLNILTPYMNTQRIVCADSYFASVTAAELLHMKLLKFIGVIKTAT